jgi:hypothetical protein
LQLTEYHDSQHCEIVVSGASTSSSLNLSPLKGGTGMCISSSDAIPSLQDDSGIYMLSLQATNETRGPVDRETQDRQTPKENSARRIKLLTRHFPEKKKKRLPNRIPQAFLRVMQRSHK